ncbi:hypothetical protein DMC30DRAFT_403061 [Rhodotorula diobovata]|uniref:Uncharacterized protein n=1 Tax=Rhodotorula diobovata TaxID=5288 RepID=A0A5C5FNN2_9BASI|nr:hypothetical protein DMC30DRAFT_403061 [Rhodotorula diobovata]
MLAPFLASRARLEKVNGRRGNLPARVPSSLPRGPGPGRSWRQTYVRLTRLACAERPSLRNWDAVGAPPRTGVRPTDAAGRCRFARRLLLSLCPPISYSTCPIAATRGATHPPRSETACSSSTTIKRATCGSPTCSLPRTSSGRGMPRRRPRGPTSVPSASTTRRIGG